MPIIKSAKKRVRVQHKATVRNKKTKRSLKSAVKVFNASLSGDKKKAQTAHAAAMSEIDKALKKNIISKNKAARKKAQLAKAAKEAKTGIAAKSAAKSPATKAPAKKTPAKKPAAKKPTAKK